MTAMTDIVCLFWILSKLSTANHTIINYSQYCSYEDEEIRVRKRKWSEIQEKSDQSYDSGVRMASMKLKATPIRGMMQENVEESWQVI